MGLQASKKPRRRGIKKPSPDESVSDYHCYSCNISSEQNIENNHLFKELLYIQMKSITEKPKIQRSNLSSLINAQPSRIINQSMALASAISEAYSKEISLSFLLSYRLELNIGQLDYSNESKGFDSVLAGNGSETNEKVYMRYEKYKDAQIDSSDANRYRNYLMNDTISTRTESTLKGKPSVVSNSNANGVSNSQVNGKVSPKEKSLKDKLRALIEKSSPSDMSSRKISPRFKIVLPQAEKKEGKNTTLKKEFNNSKDESKQHSRMRVFEIKPPSNRGERSAEEKGLVRNEKGTKTTQGVRPIKTKHENDKLLKSPELKLKPSNTPLNNAKKHIYNPHPNNKAPKYTKSPEPLLKKGDQSKRIRVKNLNININSLNVINTYKQIEDETRSKSNDQSTPSQTPIPNFKVNLAQVLGRPSFGANSLTNEKEKYSISSQDSNPKDIRRIDTPKFHHHKKSQSSKQLYEFNPNKANTNGTEQPLSGEKFSFSNKYSIKSPF